MKWKKLLLKVSLIPLLFIASIWLSDLIPSFQLVIDMQDVWGIHWRIFLAYSIIIVPLIGSVIGIILILRHFAKLGDYIFFKSSTGKINDGWENKGK